MMTFDEIRIICKYREVEQAVKQANGEIVTANCSGPGGTGYIMARFEGIEKIYRFTGLDELKAFANGLSLRAARWTNMKQPG